MASKRAACVLGGVRLISSARRTSVKMGPLRSLKVLEAGSNTVFDTLAAKIIGRSGIPLVVLDGRKPVDPRKAIKAKKGTLVSDKKGWKDIVF
jgi:uridylate kinase